MRNSSLRTNARPTPAPKPARRAGGIWPAKGRLWAPIWRWILALISVTGVTLLYRLLPVHIATLVASYLLVVLALATTLRFPEVLAAALLATLELNYFFIPPVGTFTIADSQNWVALAAFLLAAAIGSRLSWRGRQRAEMAELRLKEVARLLEFSRALLLITPGKLAGEIERWLVSGFGYD